MTFDEATEIVMLIKAATAARVEETTEEFFVAAMLSLDYDLALAAATVGTITWRKFPAWSEFKEIYRSQKRLKEPEQQPEDQGSEEAPLPKRGVAAPEWVHVWRWCRTERESQVWDFLPQQEGDPQKTMSMETYEGLRKEWKEAGSPKYSKPLPL